MNEIDKKTESLLAEGWVSPPSGFRDTVMQNIAGYERERAFVEGATDHVTPVALDTVPWWQWLALTTGGVIGVGQVMRFIFSVWFVTTAG